MINSFRGQYRFLSNFWPAKVAMDGRFYPSVEHAYQAGKTTDENLRDKIRSAQTPGIAKRYGRHVRLRPEWESIKLYLMEKLLRQKFGLDPIPVSVPAEMIRSFRTDRIVFFHEDLRTKLLATYPEKLIEGNTWGDTFWGVCNGEGQNHLGKLLMKIRKEIRNA